jgi:non-heme chloroperoxidase
VVAAPERFTFEAGRLTLVGDHRAGSRSRPLVFLHGGGQTRHSWDRTAERLAAVGWETFQLDSRGHGESGWDPAGDYGNSAFYDDLVAFLETRDRPVVLIGASLGGFTSLEVTAEHPELVAGLVLVDVVVKFEPSGVDRIRAFMTGNQDGFASLEEVADAVAGYNPHRPRPQNIDGLRKNVSQGEDGRWRWHWDPNFTAFSVEAQRRSDTERIGEAAAARILAPTLLVRGMKSDVVSDAGLADMRSRIPAAHVVEVGAAGHMVAGDDNDLFTGALDDFLAGLE